MVAAVNSKNDPPIPFFWLHIKKAGGTSIRSMLQPHYREVDRTQRPPCFIQSSPVEYNDILNNYRVVLGDYQFRRALFAKTYLYPDHWDRILSFAFVREPTSRAVSMFVICSGDRFRTGSFRCGGFVGLLPRQRRASSCSWIA